MDFLVHAAGMYRATAVLSRVHTTFFNYNYFNKIINISYKIVLAKIMNAWI